MKDAVTFNVLVFLITSLHELYRRVVRKRTLPFTLVSLLLSRLRREAKSVNYFWGNMKDAKFSTLLVDYPVDNVVDKHPKHLVFQRLEGNEGSLLTF
jgi:hypothetical protein